MDLTKHERRRLLELSHLESKWQTEISRSPGSRPRIRRSFRPPPFRPSPAKDKMVRVELAEDVHSDAIDGTIEGWIEIKN